MKLPKSLTALLLPAPFVFLLGASEDTLQAKINKACQLRNTPYGEVCGTIELPAGSIDLTKTLVIGDLDAKPDSINDEAKTPRDGRVMSLVIRGQGRGPQLFAGSLQAGTSINWKGPPGEPMILLLGASHLVIEGVGLNGNGKASHCVLAKSDFRYGQNDGHDLSLACASARVGVEYTDGDLPKSSPKVNGRSEGITFDLWMRDVVEGLVWDINNSQRAEGKLHIQTWGTGVAKAMGIPIKPGSEDSCGGAASPAMACAVDHRQGNLIIEGASIADGKQKGPRDHDYHATGGVIDVAIRDTIFESRGGGYLAAVGGSIESATFENISIYDFRTSGSVPCLDWASNGFLQIAGFRCLNQSGGDLSLRIHPQSRGDSFLDIRSLRLNTRYSSGKASILIEPSKKGNLSGEVTSAFLCDDDPKDGFCDFDGTTPANRLSIVFTTLRKQP